MIEQDTVKLLRECDAGVKMGVESIAEVLDDVRSDALRRLLAECKREHDVLSRRFCLRFHGRHYICNVCDILLCCTCPRETNLKTGGTQVCVGIPFGSFCASCVDSAAEAEKHKKSNVIIAVLLCAGPLFFSERAAALAHRLC